MLILNLRGQDSARSPRREAKPGQRRHAPRVLAIGSWHTGYQTEARRHRSARTLDDRGLAAHVLKGGRCGSYGQLPARAGEVEFSVRPPEGNSFSEGDVSEVGVLIAVDDCFVGRRAAVIEEVSTVIRSKEQGWM
jgi:hypothetical protein